MQGVGDWGDRGTIEESSDLPYLRHLGCIRMWTSAGCHARPLQSYVLHIGASLNIPTDNAHERPAMEQQPALSSLPADSKAVRDPFEVRSGA